MFRTKNKSTDKVCQLCQEKACKDVDDDMLPGGKCRDTYRQCHYDRSNLIPHRIRFLCTDPDETEPTDQTVNGWKEVVCRIDLIEKCQHGIKCSRLRYFRSRHGCRQKNKEHKTDQFCHDICAGEAKGLFFVETTSHDIIRDPKQIASKIDQNGPGNTRKHFVYGKG